MEMRLQGLVKHIVVQRDHTADIVSGRFVDRTPENLPVNCLVPIAGKCAGFGSGKYAL